MKTPCAAIPETDCSHQPLLFQDLGTRQVVADFSGGYLSSDGGALLLRQMDRGLGLTRTLAQAFTDRRDPRYCDHTLQELLAQRLCGLALGYEDLNDHGTLRSDPAIQTAVGRDESLASSPTLCRYENWASPQSCWEISRVLVEIFIESFSSPPAELILDFQGAEQVGAGRDSHREAAGAFARRCDVRAKYASHHASPAALHLGRFEQPR